LIFDNLVEKTRTDVEATENVGRRTSAYNANWPALTNTKLFNDTQRRNFLLQHDLLK